MTMKSKLLILGVISLLGITSCARHVSCPTYSNHEIEETKINNDREV